MDLKCYVLRSPCGELAQMVEGDVSMGVGKSRVSAMGKWDLSVANVMVLRER